MTSLSERLLVFSSYQPQGFTPKCKRIRGTIDRVVIKSGGRIYFLKVEEIDWIEAESNYLSLHSGNQSHLISETMSDFHAKLDSQQFIRIHRSSIINTERVKDIQALFKGEYVITLTSGKRLKSSRGYRRELQVLLDDAR